MQGSEEYAGRHTRSGLQKRTVLAQRLSSPTLAGWSAASILSLAEDGETEWCGSGLGGGVSLRSGAAQRRSAGTGACGAIDSRGGDVIH